MFGLNRGLVHSIYGRRLHLGLMVVVGSVVLAGCGEMGSAPSPTAPPEATVSAAPTSAPATAASSIEDAATPAAVPGDVAATPEVVGASAATPAAVNDDGAVEATPVGSPSAGATPLAFASAAALSTPIANMAEQAIQDCWAADQKETSDEMGKQYTQMPEMRVDPAKTYTATLVTNKGTIQVELYPGDAPLTVNNFVCLANDGYYNGTPFHRIVKGFVIQGGDPMGTGAGGPGYQFKDEPVSKDYERGILAMANAGPNTNGSQFFIVLEDLRGKLPKNYTIFGRVTEGLDVVDAIANTPTSVGRSGEKSTPNEAITLESVTVAES